MNWRAACALAIGLGLGVSAALGQSGAASGAVTLGTANGLTLSGSQLSFGTADAGVANNFQASAVATVGPGISGGGTGPTLLGSRHSAGYGSLWLGVATPSASNYAVSSGPSGDTTLNCSTGQQLSFGINNGIVGYFNSTGETITGAYNSSAASGSNGFACTTSGCRFDLGAGASDYLDSDGTYVRLGGGTMTGSNNNATLGLNGVSGAGVNWSSISSFYCGGAGCTLAGSSPALTVNGSISAGSSLTKGSITLSGGTGTATVLSGAVCVCEDNTVIAAAKCTVSGTTLTATAVGVSDVVAYICL